MREVVLKLLKKVVDISNSNIIKNANGLLATRPANQNIEWAGKTRKRVPENRYSLPY